MSNEESGTHSSGSPADERGGARRVSGPDEPAAPEAEAGTEAEGAGSDAGRPTGSAEDAMGAKKEQTGEKSGSFWKELPLLIVIALVLAFVIKTWVVQPFYIPSGSMEDTLQINDRVLVNKLVYQVRDIERGDIVVFNGTGTWDEPGVEAPETGNAVNRVFTWVGQQLGVQPTGKDYIKRVIGVGGDTVECCDSDGRVMVNGEPLDEDYLFPGSQETHTEFGPVEVPEGRLWLMGDHRQISYDSRLHQTDPGEGTIAEDEVVGRAFVLMWPLDRVRTLPIPDTFESLNAEGEAAGETAGGGDGGAAGSADGGPEPVAAAAVPAAPLLLGAAAAVPVHRTGRGLWRRRPGWARQRPRRGSAKSHAGDSGE
nr:signal peptidase I [Nocardiopsis halophila]